MKESDRLRIEELNNGNPVTFRPRGNSMTPKIKSGELIRIVPIPKDYQIKKGDIVYVKVRGNIYVHLVSAISIDGVQISYKNVFGILA